MSDLGHCFTSDLGHCFTSDLGHSSHRYFHRYCYVYYPRASPCPREPWALTCVHPDVLRVPRKHNFLRSTFWRPVLATKATKKEYSGRLGFQHGSKMEPKMEPRRRRPTLTKHAPAWSDRMSTPPGELPFRSFSYTGKRSPTSRHNHSDLRTWLQNDPQSAPRGSPKGDPNLSKIVIESSLSRRGLPQATSDIPEGLNDDF